jgi:Uma2 family endonuclease
MNTAVATAPIKEMLDRIQRLEPGQRQLFQGVSWQAYEALLEQLGNNRALRTTYTKGDLEVMAPLHRHEIDKETLTAMGRILAKGYGLRALAAGSTTFKRPDLWLSAEPDSCYYLRDVTKVIGKERIELGIDPPPDLVIEVDVTSHSHSKIATYAGFGVPEFCRLEGAAIEIYELIAGQYQLRSHSPTFPGLQAHDLAAFLEQSRAEGQDIALDAFEAWVGTFPK